MGQCIRLRGRSGRHGMQRESNSKITSVAAGIVDGVNIKSNTWYACRGGKLVGVKR